MTYDLVGNRNNSRYLIRATDSANYCRPQPDVKLQALADSHPSGAAVLNDSGTILYLNRAWHELSAQRGFPIDPYGVGRNYLEISRHASDSLTGESAELAAGVEQVLRGRASEFQKDYLSSGPIDERWIRIHAGHLDSHHTDYVMVTREDITESKRSNQARTKDALRLQLLLNVTHIFPWEAAFPSGLFTFVGGQAVSLLGYPIEDWYQPGFWPAHLHPQDRKRALVRWVEYSSTRNNYELEFRMIAKDNRVVWLHNVVSVIRENGEPRTLLGFSIDVTESKEFKVTLKDLSSRLINAQEEERRRVARELHDDLNQRMAILSIELEQLGKTKKPANLKRRLQSLKTKAQQISADIHQLSYRLHPSKLDHLGLAAAVKGLCQELSSGGSLQVEFEQNGFPANPPEEVTLCIYRIAQEALRNCVKHSGASSALVLLQNTGGEIRLTVEDAGRGFMVNSATMKKGLGFTSMQDRLRIVGGKMQIHAKPKLGTHIEVSVPLAVESEDL
jgi:PAS domain S-box-containing protein